MKYLKQLIASLVLVGFLAPPALADGRARGHDLGESTLLLTSPSGKVVEMHMTDQEVKDMMSHDATLMTGGIMMMMHDGKMYMIQDKKMPDGKTLSEVMMSK